MIKVYLKGPILTQSGYGHHARTVYRALKTREDIFEVGTVSPDKYWHNCRNRIRQNIRKLARKIQYDDKSCHYFTTRDEVLYRHSV